MKNTIYPIVANKRGYNIIYTHKGKEIAEEVQEHTNKRGEKIDSQLYLNSDFLKGDCTKRHTKEDYLRDCTQEQRIILEKFKGKVISEYFNL